MLANALLKENRLKTALTYKRLKLIVLNAFFCSVVDCSSVFKIYGHNKRYNLCSSKKH